MSFAMNTADYDAMARVQNEYNDLKVSWTHEVGTLAAASGQIALFNPSSLGKEKLHRIMSQVSMVQMSKGVVPPTSAHYSDRDVISSIYGESANPLDVTSVDGRGGIMDSDSDDLSLHMEVGARFRPKSRVFVLLSFIACLESSELVDSLLQFHSVASGFESLIVARRP